MNGFYFQIAVGTIHDAIAILLSLLIIFHHCISVYYGVKMIILKGKNKFGWCPEMLSTYTSILWLILFVYILVGTLGNNKIILSNSFGAVFIRPLILVSSVVEAVIQKRRYLSSKNKFEEESYLKENLEQED